MKKNIKKTFWLLLYFFIVSLFIIAARALAQETATLQNASGENNMGNRGGRFAIYGDLGGRLNPQGLGFFGGINYRNVYRYDENFNAPSAYWQTGLGLGMSPAMMQASAHVEWQPWIFLPLRIQCDYYEFFGASGGLLSFTAPNAFYGDDVRKNRSDEERAHAQRVLFQPTLQGKIDRIIIRNRTDFAYYKFSGQGPYFLELVHDTLLKDGDYLVSNRTHFLYSVFDGIKDKMLLAGPYYEVTRAFDAQITQQKAGLSLYWEPAISLWQISRPHLGAVTGYHLQDPNRQGQLFLIMGAGFQFGL